RFATHASLARRTFLPFPNPYSLIPDPRSLRPRSTATITAGDHFARMTTPKAHEQTRILVQAAAKVCEDKKGEDTRILELDPVDSGLSDFFLITSALNDRQAQTIADEIELKLKREFNILP